MAPDSQHEVRLVVDLLVCAGSTNITEGLRIGTKVLKDRCQRNPMANIMLLSDGHDTYSRRSANVQVSVHAFGFEVEHDASTMHSISKETGGTFSLIETVGLVQDAFAQCIGDLMSVVVKDMSVTVSACTGTKLKSFHAGSYETCVIEDGSQGTVNMCDLYAEEERDILVELKLPAVSSTSNTMNLISIRCFYKDPVSERNFKSREHSLSILRPKSREGTPVAPNLEVEKQRTRLRAAQAIAEAKMLADQGEMADAQRVLHSAKIELQQIRTHYRLFSLALEIFNLVARE